MLNQKGLVGHEQISASRFVRRGGATDRTGLGNQLRRQKVLRRPVEGDTDEADVGILPYCPEDKLGVEGRYDNLGGATIMFGRIGVLTIGGDGTASLAVVVVFRKLGGVGFTSVLGAGQGEGCFAHTRTVHPLQRQADTDHQEVESEPGGEPPCEVTVKHDANLRSRGGYPASVSLNALLT